MSKHLKLQNMYLSIPPTSLLQELLEEGVHTAQTTEHIKVTCAKCTQNKLFKRQSGETPQLLRAHLFGHAIIICAKL